MYRLTEICQTLYFKWVNFMVYKVYLSNISKLKNQNLVYYFFQKKKKSSSALMNQPPMKPEVKKVGQEELEGLECLETCPLGTMVTRTHSKTHVSQSLKGPQEPTGTWSQHS